MHIIVLAGMPASGKSTVAKALSKAFGLPVLAKDDLKEAIFDTMGFRDYAEKRRTDHAANAVLLKCTKALLDNNQSMILDNNFDSISSKALDELVCSYNCKCVIVFFGGNNDAFYRRYVERDRQNVRHLGHVLQLRYPPEPGDALYHEMSREEFREKFETRGIDQFQCTGERIELDATDPANINIEELIEKIRSLI